ncbi:hypothetical protein CH373_01120 [Leptospira perolatii]|uniref:Uncharacterized protein n=1 Tax=Leptospira perolatii TaxID=2023191 RepID=A0A2M9ZRJ4_9LEPT|nr:hypothetical protein [Leptospira perolatii]PJZ71149.1 hypothetical protein CH360_01120 [Leptospira perolatii]PJZ74682.1 hypothetical protein CH373_01120 [Leptospira perolatii]
MMYSEMNPDLRSSFTKLSTTFANLTNDSVLPTFGLKAANLLDSTQMKKLTEIRKRRINSKQWQSFEKD